jgi:hypothetical protein
MFLMQLDQGPANRLRRGRPRRRAERQPVDRDALALPLEKVGFVKREADPRDARVGYVVLTKAAASASPKRGQRSIARPRRLSATAGATRRSPAAGQAYSAVHGALRRRHYLT